MKLPWRPLETAPRLMPVWGMAIGTMGGLAFWLGAQVWPASIAVVLSMLVTAALSAQLEAGAAASGKSAFVLALLLKYSALMALSSANLPFALPANVSLGLIMIAGHAASRALMVSALTSFSLPNAKPPSHADLGVALVLGFSPAFLIGLPGLIGLTGAIVARMGFVAYRRRRPHVIAAADMDRIQHLSEVCFYLGVLAARVYV
jgi:cobalamin synthase